MRTATTVLMACLLGLAVFCVSCHMFLPKVQAKDPQSGALLYLDARGAETTAATDAMGQPNQPLMEYASESPLLNTAGQFASGLPAPWGTILASGIGLLTAGVTGWGAAQNAKARAARQAEKEARADADAGAEVIRSIEADPVVKKTVIERLAGDEKKGIPPKHSPKTKAFVAKVTAGT